MLHYIAQHIAMFFGLTDINGSWYAWWSGIGSDLGELSIAAAIFHGLLKVRKQHKEHQEQVHNQISQLVAGMKGND